MTNSFIPYAHQSISEEDIQSVAEALRRETITRGSLVEEFENAAASYCGARYAVAYNSGSSALQAAFHAAKTSKYDRVLTTPNTFIATVGPAVQRGAAPIFHDIDLKNGNLQLENLSHSLHYRSTRGRNILVPVHFAGIPVDVQEIDRSLADPEAIIIEDAAHALGSKYSDEGPRIGACLWSHMTVFSFHPAKTITTGEGGMVTTNDESLFHELKRFRNNGIERDSRYFRQQSAGDWYYEVQELTGNYNFTDFQAALGISQLKRLEDFIAKRRQLVQAYRQQLAGLENVRLFDSCFDSHTAYHLFVVQIDFEAFKTTRQEVMQKLKEKGIGTQVHYMPVYSHPSIKTLCGEMEEYFPNMEKYRRQALSLPLYFDMDISDIERVVSSLKGALAG